MPMSAPVLQTHDSSSVVRRVGSITQRMLSNPEPSSSATTQAVSPLPSDASSATSSQGATSGFYPPLNLKSNSGATSPTFGLKYPLFALLSLFMGNFVNNANQKVGGMKNRGKKVMLKMWIAKWKKGEVLILPLRNFSLLFFTGRKLRSPGIGIEVFCVRPLDAENNRH